PDIQLQKKRDRKKRNYKCLPINQCVTIK
uniref:Uncharacterized protein n=1 Tax=Panagrolaimus sp. PS1159 TaxID=55785 RepID=A0AC35GRH1_9BILA